MNYIFYFKAKKLGKFKNNCAFYLRFLNQIFRKPNENFMLKEPFNI